MANPLNDKIVQVGTVFRKFASGFAGAAYGAGAASLAALAADWEVVRNTGGMTPTLNNGNLAINMGTTNGAELLLVSRQAQTIPLNVTAVLAMSQRIAANEVRIGIVEVDKNGVIVPNPNIGGVANNYAGVRFDGTTATSVVLETVEDGIGSITTQAVSSQATTAAAAEYALEIRNEDVLLTSSVANSTTSRATTVGRLNTVVPNPNRSYRMVIWLKNSGVPASATTVTLSRVLMADIQELQAEVGGGRGNLSQSQAIPVTLVGTQSQISVNGTVASGPSTSTGGFSSSYHLIAAAGNNLATVKASAATLGTVVASNASAADRYLKVYNKSSAPVLASDTPIITLLVPAGQTVTVPLPAGLRMSNGIAIATTTGIAVTDTGALTAADMAIHLDYV